jgi:hypothetical protein
MSTLNITTTLVENEFVVEAIIASTGDIPTDIFMYENTGEGLGDYQGVCTIDEYKRMQTFNEDPIPKFGNKFIKYTRAIIHLPLTYDVSALRTKITNDVKAFKTAFITAESNTQVIPI